MVIKRHSDEYNVSRTKDKRKEKILSLMEGKDMNKSLREFYEKKNPIAVMGITNTLSIQILDVSCIHVPTPFVIIKGFTGDIHKIKIYDSTKGAYFKYSNRRYYIKDFMKI